MPSASTSQPAHPSPRNRQVLAFMAEHLVVTRRQVEILTGASASATATRLRRLERDELIARDTEVTGGWLIAGPGLKAIASPLPVPNLNLGEYKHSIGLAWLWLAAQAGAFGPVAEVVGERRMRSHDEATVSPEELYSVRLGGHDAHGRERRHYPDVLLVDPHGRRLALELELSAKKVAAREAILGGYGSDRRLDGVLYLVEDNFTGRSVARGIHATAAEMNLVDRVHIRCVSPILPGPRQSQGRNPERTAVRAGRRSVTRAAAAEAGR